MLSSWGESTVHTLHELSEHGHAPPPQFRTAVALVLALCKLRPGLPSWVRGTYSQFRVFVFAMPDGYAMSTRRCEIETRTYSNRLKASFVRGRFVIPRESAFESCKEEYSDRICIFRGQDYQYFHSGHRPAVTGLRRKGFYYSTHSEKKKFKENLTCTQDPTSTHSKAGAESVTQAREMANA